MNFFISDALAQSAAPPGGGLVQFAFMIGMFFLAMYFLVIRPQSKRAKEHKQLLESLSKGDEIVTSGGVLGRITDVDENFLQVDVAPGVSIKVQKQAVTQLMPKGTMTSDRSKQERIQKDKGQREKSKGDSKA
jgi:preprotein translocase subunit YajC